MVTPCVGVWIETIKTILREILFSSHPAWVCGLKHLKFRVASSYPSHTLRGCVDWNKIFVAINYLKHSHTLRGCVDWNGKPAEALYYFMGHTLRGCVDWNWKHTVRFSTILVTPCVGVWIETMKYLKLTGMCLSHPAWVCGLKHVKHACKPFYNSHTLRGCVDWNSSFAVSNVTSSSVTPCVGVWIETNQVYGYPDYPGHTLRGCVDWNFWFYLLI